MSYETLHKAIREHSSGMDDETIIDAGRHGADAGWPGFTYTGDCVEFYEANKADIWELAQDMADDMGAANVPALVGTFNRSDMADTADGFANLLAWFALEEVGRWLEENPQDDEDEDAEEGHTDRSSVGSQPGGVRPHSPGHYRERTP